jgi:signal peptidase I
MNLSYFGRWLTSGTVRRASELRRQIERLVNEQRDLLAPEAIAAVETAASQLNDAIKSAKDKQALQTSMVEAENVANARLLPYPHASARENIKEIAVAVTVIFAFTTFFLQLTKIPTNSLVPTLYGITGKDLRGQPEVQIPGAVARFFEYWLHGVSYYHVVAKEDGALEDIEPARLIVPFVKKQRLRVGQQWYTIWFPPERLEERMHSSRVFRAGEDILKLRVVAGDHLLVDRLTYNFRRPQRGEIFVFKTRGIEGLPEGQLYIKRLVALGGEHVRIGDDQHLVINGQRLDALR